MKKSDKQVLIDDVSQRLRRAKGLYFTDFSGMTVEQVTLFRSELRKAQIDFKVAKNTFIQRALNEVGGYDGAEAALFGPTGIAFGYDDAVEPARVLKKFVDKNEKPKLKMAFVEGTAYKGKDLAMIAALPSRNDLIAGILGSLQSPASGIVGSINAVMRDLTSIIEEVAKKRAA
jgi:large subunit ribosomal protein L10